MLEIRDINKHYGTHQVLTNVSFSVGAGRMTGFVGANGAGKTTSMRIILGCSRRTPAACFSTASRSATATAAASGTCRRNAASTPR